MLTAAQDNNKMTNTEVWTQDKHNKINAKKKQNKNKNN